jgi:hypothetical protein
VKFCQIFKHKFGKTTLLAYAGNRARAALIHELLHLKYVEDEKTVRELAKEYFFVFIQKQSVQGSNRLWVYTLIFKANNQIDSMTLLKTSFMQAPINPNLTLINQCIPFQQN